MDRALVRYREPVPALRVTDLAKICFERNNPRPPSSNVSRGMVVFSSGRREERTTAAKDTSNEACAVASETPGFVRPIILSHQICGLDAPSSDPFFPRGATSGWELKGRNKSGADCTLFVPVNPGGVTPMIVTGTMLTLIVSPRTEGEAPNARCHRPALINATVGAPTTSSAGRIGRPICGGT